MYQQIINHQILQYSSLFFLFSLHIRSPNQEWIKSMTWLSSWSSSVSVVVSGRPRKISWSIFGIAWILRIRGRQSYLWKKFNGLLLRPMSRKPTCWSIYMYIVHRFVLPVWLIDWLYVVIYYNFSQFKKYWVLSRELIPLQVVIFRLKISQVCENNKLLWHFWNVLHAAFYFFSTAGLFLSWIGDSVIQMPTLTWRDWWRGSWKFTTYLSAPTTLPLQLHYMLALYRRVRKLVMRNTRVTSQCGIQLLPINLDNLIVWWVSCLQSQLNHKTGQGAHLLGKLFNPTDFKYYWCWLSVLYYLLFVLSGNTDLLGLIETSLPRPVIVNSKREVFIRLQI